MTAIIAVLLSVLAPAPAAAAPCAATAPADRVAGQWTGAFAGADWTFELSPGPKGWSGRYRTTRAPVWHPLEDVSVAGGCATFSLKSEPRVTFALALAPDGGTLGGDVTISGLATLPFSARREP